VRNNEALSENFMVGEIFKIRNKLELLFLFHSKLEWMHAANK